MKTTTIFISLKASAYAPEGEEPEKLYAGELVYCRDAEVGQEVMIELVRKFKRLIEKEIGIST